MGGLWRKHARTHLDFLVGVLAIAGIPPLSGFFSKDEILLSAFGRPGSPAHRWLLGDRPRDRRRSPRSTCSASTS